MSFAFLYHSFEIECHYGYIGILSPEDLKRMSRIAEIRGLKNDHPREGGDPVLSTIL
jgi:hypothetical protein